MARPALIGGAAPIRGRRPPRTLIAAAGPGSCHFGAGCPAPPSLGPRGREFPGPRSTSGRSAGWGCLPQGRVEGGRRGAFPWLVPEARREALARLCYEGRIGGARLTACSLTRGPPLVEKKTDLNNNGDECMMD